MSSHSSPRLESLEVRRLMAGDFPNAQDVDVAYDASGTLHMAYYDAAAHALMYARRGTDGAWSDAVTVDAGSADIGRQPSLAIDRAGRPAIAYRDQAQADLRYAILNADGSTWKVSVVDKTRDVGQNPSLGFDGANRPVISYYKATGRSIMLATFDGRKWRMRALGAAGVRGDGVSDLAIDPATGRWAVAFDSNDRLLQLSQQVGAGARTTTVAKMTAGGGQPSVAFGPGGVPAVTFYENATHQIVLVQPLTVRTWAKATIAAAVDASTPKSDLSFDPVTGAAQVAYYSPAVGGIVLTDKSTGTTALLQATTNGNAIAVAREPGDGTVTAAQVGSTGKVEVKALLTPAADVSVTGWSVSTVNLVWSDGGGAKHTNVVQRSVDGVNFVDVAQLASDVGTFDDGALTDGTPYLYRIKSVTGAGNAVYSAAVSAVTRLAAPGPLTVQAVEGHVSLTWTDNASAETGYVIERSSDGMTFEPVATAPAGSTSYADMTAAERHVYWYIVRAVRDGAPAAASAYAVGWPVQTRLGAPTAFEATVVTPTNVMVTWLDNSALETGYALFRSEDGVNFSPLAQLAADGTSYSDSTVQEGRRYFYRLTATGDGDAVTVGPAVTFTGTLPPGNVTATVVGSRVDVAWVDRAGGETGYVVERSVDGGAHYGVIATLPANAQAYSDTSVVERQAYRYRVAAVVTGDGFTGQTYGQSVAVTPPLPPPGSFSATPQGPTSMRLTWADTSARETGYVVQRSTDGVTYATIALVPTGTTLYNDNGLAEGTHYYYRVVNYDASTFSAGVTADAYTPPAAPTLNATAASYPWQIQLVWTDNSQVETGYIVSVSSNGTAWQVVTDSLPAGTTSYTMSGSVAGYTFGVGQNYYFAVQAKTATGLSTSSNVGFVHLAPQVPAVIPTPQPGGVLLNWAGTGAGDGFRVMRSGDGTNYTQIASLVSGATAYLDGNLPEATPFAYKVIAFAGSETAASDVVVTNTRLRTATAFSGTQVGADRVDFTWSDNSSAETGYVVYADAGGFWMFDPTVLPANTTSYSWNGLELGTAYDFYVIAVGPGFSGDDLGSLAPTVNSLPSAKWSMTTPSGPNMLEAQPTGPTSMGLHWQDSSTTETGFQIERSTDGTTWATVGTAAANATAYADTGLTAGTAYYYRVRETGSAYASFPSAAVTWLNVPTGLTAQAISNHRVQLNWSAAPGQQDEFYVEFSTDGLNWLGLGTVSGSVYAYTVSAQPDGSPLQAGQTYYFRIGRARLDATWGRTASEPTVAVSVAAT